MRLTLDPAADVVRLTLSDAAVARQATPAEGVVLEWDAGGRLVGVALRDLARRSGQPDALAALTLDVADLPRRPAVAVAPVGPPDAPAPRAASQSRAEPPSAVRRPSDVLTSNLLTSNVLSWAPEAEAAMAAVPFFRRGPMRHAVVALARERGLAEVTAALVDEARRGVR